MTEPGEIEKVPLKVVPMYIEDDIVVEARTAGEPETVEQEEPRPERPRTPLVGALALAASVLAVLVDAAAIVIATNGTYATATALAFLAIALSTVGIVGGIVAIIMRRGRLWGIIAAALGLIANPFFLLVGLEFLGGVRT